MANAPITDTFVSYIENPEGFPQWFNYTPTYTPAGSMTFTTVTTNYAIWTVRGRSILINIRFQGTVGGTPSASIKQSLPFIVQRHSFHNAIIVNGSNFDNGMGVIDSGLTGIDWQFIAGGNFSSGSNRGARSSFTYDF